MSSNRTVSYIPDHKHLSAGGVLVDELNDRVLILWEPTLQEYLLPKGHKDPDESIEETAVREVYEETGYRNELVATSATNCSKQLLAVQIRPTSSVGNPGIKVIYWFYSRLADSRQDSHTQESYENFVSEWHTVDEAVKRLSYEEDRQLVWKAWCLSPAGVSAAAGGVVVRQTPVTINNNNNMYDVVRDASDGTTSRLMIFNDCLHQIKQSLIVIDSNMKKILLNKSLKDNSCVIYDEFPVYTDPQFDGLINKTDSPVIYQLTANNNNN
ncbi:uncharacterized protein LOC128952273, partial [Oppia nitens]|uniref:uncharacterized protein LOC128952273 n=1 Tax=Oppia nitens TaxID=1686743 RepID=UPI0023DC164C